MAKSLRSKSERKKRAIKRVRYGAKELERLKNMLEAAKTEVRGEDRNPGFKLVPAADIAMADGDTEKMETGNEKVVNPKTLRDQFGQYPVWMNRRKIKKMKGPTKKKGSGKRKKT